MCFFPIRCYLCKFYCADVADGCNKMHAQLNVHSTNISIYIYSIIIKPGHAIPTPSSHDSTITLCLPSGSWFEVNDPLCDCIFLNMNVYSKHTQTYTHMWTIIPGALFSLRSFCFWWTTNLIDPICGQSTAPTSERAHLNTRNNNYDIYLFIAYISLIVCCAYICGCTKMSEWFDADKRVDDKNNHMINIINLK